MSQHTTVYDLPLRREKPAPRFVELFSRQIGAFIGIGLMLIVAVAGVALATWNVADPSFSVANSNPVSNLLGYPGAVFADLAMQFFGLGAVAALLPPFFWAVLLMGQRNITHLLRRFLFWFISLFAFCGLIALVPPFSHWPLPLGLGGVTGDKILGVFSYVFGAVPVYGFFPVVAVILGALTLWSMTIASGIFSKAPIADHFAEEPADEDFSADEPHDGFFTALSGLIMHLVLTTKATLYRHLIRGKAPTKETSDYNNYHSFSHERIEPDFVTTADDNDDDYNYDTFEMNEPLQAAETPPPARPAASAAPRRKVALRSQFGFTLPSLDFLAEAKKNQRSPALSQDALQQNADYLSSILEDFSVRGTIVHVNPGPVVTLYEFEPAPGVKSARVIGLADDIARSMSAISARVAVIPGRNAIGIELPNPTRETVYLREIMETRDFQTSKAKLALALGKTIGGDTVIADLAKMPHLLVAGTTGSGKSVAINTMILSLLYRMTPQQCRLIMVDPKMLELSVYDGIPHLLTPVVTDPKKAVVALKWAVREMEERYRKMAKIGVRNIDGFNARVNEAREKGEELSRTVQTGFDKESGKPVFETEIIDTEPMPYIVVIIDEMADLMMVAGKEIEGAVQRLAQMARAAGIHVVMATQRPSVDVITGTIKANFPTRISFSVTSKIDSRTILGEQGAEQLLGQGDMLFMMGGGRTQRVHGPFVSDTEVEDIVNHLRAQGAPDYLDNITEDEDSADNDGMGLALAQSNPDDPYDQAVAVVLRDRKVSTSYIQRRLGIGYNRAASIIERMEEEGLISAPNHVGKREILVPENENAY